MILLLNEQEMAVLVLHMSVMRKNVRKGFKSNSSVAHKEALASYDEVKNAVSEVLEGTDEKVEQVLNFNIKEVDMLHEFLQFYIGELESELSQGKLTDVANQVTYLKNILVKVQDLKIA